MIIPRWRGTNPISYTTRLRRADRLRLPSHRIEIFSAPRPFGAQISHHDTLVFRYINQTHLARNSGGLRLEKLVMRPAADLSPGSVAVFSHHHATDPPP